MEITALSDIHASYKMLDRIIAQEQNSDIILIAGDITTFGGAAEVAGALKKIVATGKKLYAVAGNMDMPESEEELTRLGVSLNGRGVCIGDVGIFGVSAAPISILHTPYESTEEEIARRVEAGFSMVGGARTTICVPHSPPYNTTLDRIRSGLHVGSTAIRTFIEKHQPDVLICGHIHEARGQDRFGKTRMVNCGPADRGYYVHLTISDVIQIENKELM